MLTITTAQTKTDLEGILLLQQANLAQNLTPAEIAEQGFVTVTHTLTELTKLNRLENHIIAKDGGQVVGYVLAMTPQSKTSLPVLEPMFELFTKITYQNKPLAQWNYIVVGQVCIDKKYRGSGLFTRCYQAYRQRYAPNYAITITEIAEANTRSLRAHSRLGFEPVHTYTAPDGVKWVVVVWNWQG